MEADSDEDRLFFCSVLRNLARYAGVVGSLPSSLSNTLSDMKKEPMMNCTSATVHSKFCDVADALCELLKKYEEMEEWQRAASPAAAATSSSTSGGLMQATPPPNQQHASYGLFTGTADQTMLAPQVSLHGTRAYMDGGTGAFTYPQQQQTAFFSQQQQPQMQPPPPHNPYLANANTAAASASFSMTTGAPSMGGPPGGPPDVMHAPPPPMEHPMQQMQTMMNRLPPPPPAHNQSPVAGQPPLRLPWFDRGPGRSSKRQGKRGQN